ncbi:MAG: SPOR domain-containing protein [Rhizobiaceae bacterium]
MCEYKDNFLMGPKSALENGEWLDGFCFASNAADEDLAQLAALVGSQSKLRSEDSDEMIALADNAPALEFDLEEELARAFQTNETEQDREFVMADLGGAGQTEPSFGSQASTQTVPLSDTLQAQMETAAILSPVGRDEEDAISNAELSDLIALELDKALAEEAGIEDAASPAADLSESLAQPARKSSFPADDIEQELSKLMGRSVFSDAQHISADAASQTQASAPPPMPAEIAEPWQSAEVVSNFPAHDEPNLAADPAPQSIYTPVEMSDFEPEMAPADTAAEAAKTAPEDRSQNQIDVVLGGAAALAAAASTTSKPIANEASVQPQMDSELAEKDADLRLRLDELDYEHGRDKRRAGRRAAFAIVAIALLGGTAALGWNFVSGPSGDTPTLLASTDPVKVKPVDAGGKVVPNQDQAVYQAVEVNDQSVPQQDRLTDNKEQPITVAVSPTGAKTNSRVDSNQADAAPLVLKPRSVRTVVVRPDGTIVRSEASKSQAVVVNTTNVAAPILSLQNQVQNEVSARPSGVTEAPLQTAAIAPPKKVETVPVTSLRTTEAAPAPVAATNTVAKQPAAKPVAAAAPALASSSDELPQVSSPYAVQVSSQRSAAGAKRSYTTLSRRFASILDGRGVDYRQVEVKGKSYVRVRIPAKDRSTANQICSQLKSAGGDCFVTR